MKRFTTIAGVVFAAVCLSGVALAAPEGVGGINGTLFQLVKPFGILTYLLIITAASIGMNIRKKPKVLLKWHKRVAISAVCLATAHALLIAALEIHLFK